MAQNCLVLPASWSEENVVFLMRCLSARCFWIPGASTTRFLTVDRCKRILVNQSFCWCSEAKNENSVQNICNRISSRSTTKRFFLTKIDFDSCSHVWTQWFELCDAGISLPWQPCQRTIWFLPRVDSFLQTVCKASDLMIYLGCSSKGIRCLFRILEYKITRTSHFHYKVLFHLYRDWNRRSVKGTIQFLVTRSYDQMELSKHASMGDLVMLAFEPCCTSASIAQIAAKLQRETCLREEASNNSSSIHKRI